MYNASGAGHYWHFYYFIFRLCRLKLKRRTGKENKTLQNVHPRTIDMKENPFHNGPVGDNMQGPQHHQALQESVMNTDDLVPVEDAAPVFGIPFEILEKATRTNFGVMSLRDAARLLNIKPDTLYAAASADRYNKFPGALVKQYDPTTGAEIRGTVKYINILHKEFVGWRKDYHPRLEQSAKKPCALNDKDDSGNFLYVGKTYWDGDDDLKTVEPCPNHAARADRPFCSNRCYTLARKVSNRFGEMGKAGHDGKGRYGPRDRSAEATRRRSLAAMKGKRKAGRPRKLVRTIFRPEGGIRFAG